MKAEIGEVVSPRLEAPEEKVGHEAHQHERPVDLGRLAQEGLPKGAGEDLRQVAPVLDEKVLDNECPIVPDEEIAEAVAVEKRRESCDY